MTLAHSPIHFDLRDACGREGCPVCTLKTQRLASYLQAVNYESALDRGIIARLVASNGWCPRHVEAWLEQANILATAVIYQAVLTALADETPATSSRWRRRRTADPRCPACEAEEEAERGLLATLINGLNDAEFSRAYSESSGLCLPHLTAALELRPASPAATLLRERGSRTIAQLRGDLSEIARKHDYRNLGEADGPERGGDRRAIAWVSGQPVRGRG